MTGGLAMLSPGGHPGNIGQAPASEMDASRPKQPSKRNKLIKEVSIISDWDLDRAISFNSHSPKIIDRCFHDLIADQMRIRPNATALHAWDGKFTYAELNAAAASLARRLISFYKVNTGDLVHVCFEKSAWHFVSILAINKAGAAWVPLDPEYPKQRLESIVRQTGSRLLLCSVEQAQVCGNLVESTLAVGPDLVKALATDVDDSLELPTVSPTEAMYILFTSGSTGTPKGLIMQHRAVCTSQTAIAERQGLTHEVNMLQFAAFVFDLSIGEIIGTLISGGTLCVPSEEDRMGDLTSYINRTGVSWTYLTPSFARTLDPKALPGLEMLTFAGEAVPQDVFEQWFGKLRLVNGWGPAETCCFSTLHEWKSKDESPLTVGKPVGARCWIVSPEEGDAVTPLGLVGEVIIQGPTLLQEYLANPTASQATIMETPPAWIPDRANQGWTRAYRTGDLCRYNEDGALEFVNRKDTQIKVRGLRVEVSEVEHRIRTVLPKLRQVAVDALKHGTDTKLVAYLCFSDGTGRRRDKEEMFDDMTEELQKRLSALKGELGVALPDYMIPSMFIPCKFMPTITSTKLDRKGLAEAANSLTPEEQSAYSLVNGEKRTPETDMERQLQGLFAETLELAPESIGRDDSFLQIGGDSIRAIQLTARARDSDIKITVKDIFKDPRLLAVAKHATWSEKETATPDHVWPFSLIDQSLKDSILQDIWTQCSLTPGQNIDDVYPLTTLQEGLIALSVKQTGSYINKYLFRIPQHVDKELYRESWNKTVEACGNLRTRISFSGDRPYQALVSNDAVWEDTEGHNLSSLLKSMGDIEMTFGSRLCRYAMVRDDDGETYFVWQIHHAVNDGWALRLVIQTLYSFYWDVEVPKLYPYADFIKYTMGTNLDEAADFWRRELEGAKQATFPPSSQKQGTFKSMAQRLEFGKAESTSITKATVLRAAWAVVLARYCDTNDVTFGSVVSGRNASVEGLQYMPGPMIATIPVRVRMDQSQQVTGFLQAVQEQASQSVDHEQFGLHNIAKLSADARDACDFSSLLVIQPPAPTSSDDVSAHDILVTGEKENAATYDEMHSYFNYPLVFTARLMEDSVDLLVFYDASTMSQKRITALCNHFNHVAQQLSAQKNEALSAISLVGDWDLRHAIESNDIQPAKKDLIHRQIDEQIRTRPNDIAVSSWDGDLTYAQLGDYASRLAKKLQDMGVGPETLVPLIFSKSLYAVIAILAVEMAGAAFVPLDVKAPAERLRGIIRDTQASVILASTEDLMKAQEMKSGARILAVGETELNDMREATVTSSVIPENASFVIFTSGSTGRPKGVVMEHRAICSTVESYCSQMGYSAGQRVFQFSAFAFDMSIIEILSVLVSGGTICMPSEYDRVNNLTGVLKASGAESIFLTPTVAALVNPKDVPEVKLLGVGGEAITKSVVDKWRGHADIVGIYGPAETSVTATKLKLENADSATNLGRPMRSAFWVVDVDDKRRLVPVGCTGELLVQGPCLARGYLDPEQQAAGSFEESIDWLPEGFPKTGYLTGDIVRRNEDGSFEYMGRKDTQVKLHGQRVELGEIETRMRDALPSDMDGLVHVFDDERGTQKILSALLWFTRGQSGQLRLIEAVTDDIRKTVRDAHGSLERTLPSYMIPSGYLIFGGIPEQTSTGKIDRKKLVAVAQTFSTKDRLQFAAKASEIQAPTTEMEFRLRDLWSEILNIPPQDISKFDSFLRLGGDSISAISLVSMCDKEGIILSVGTIFKDPRLSAVAEAASLTAGEAVTIASLPKLSLLSLPREEVIEGITTKCHLRDDQSVDDAYPCTPLQAGLIALTVKQPGSYVARQVHKLASNVDPERFKKAWQVTMEACSNIRTRIVLLGSDTIQCVINEEAVWEPTDGIDLSAYLQRTRKFKMTYGTRLSRYALLKDRGEWYFVWMVHHTTFDGTTLKLVMDTLSQAYTDESPVGVRFPPYARFIQYVESLDIEAAGDFWKAQLEGANPITFPLNVSTSEKPSEPRTFTRTVNIGPRTDSSVTMASLIRAAWAMVLARYSDSDDVCFGMTVSGRSLPVPGAAEMSGPMLATVPVRVRVAKEQNISQFLAQIQAQGSEMVDYEQFGLQSISRLNADCKAACDFGSLLVVQPQYQKRGGASAADDAEALLKHPGEEALKMVEGLMEGFFNYPLVLQALVSESQVQLNFSYDGALLSEERMGALARHLDTVIKNMMVDEASASLGDVAMTSQWDVEKAQELTADEPQIIDDCAHHLFERQAADSPSAPAIDAWDLSLSYKQLNEAANRLAAYLIDTGVKPKDYVLVCFEKSAWCVVSVLATLKAGAAWAPVDPKHPKARQEELARQTNATVTLASKTATEVVEKLTTTVITVSNKLMETLSRDGYDCGDPQVQISGEDTCYVLFTSGSTGKPKGIVMGHRSLCTSQTAIARRFGLDQHVRLLQFSTFVFDVSIGEIIGALISGACLCIPSDEARTNELASFIREKNVNWAYMTPTLAQTISPEDVPGLELLSLGGEPVSRDLLETWFGHVRLINAWGPTETCVYSATHEYKSKDESPLTIGKPVGSRIWIVDRDDPTSLAPVGTIGELVLQGPTLLKEYLGDAEKTAAATVCSLPSWTPKRDEKSWDRFYKSGDLCFWDAAGNIRFTSRKDTQIKIRGLRVELGEIEHNVRGCVPGTKQVAVDVIVDQGAQLLVAFICDSDRKSASADGETTFAASSTAFTATVKEAVNELKKRMPEYMIPSFFIPCAYMPYSSSDKCNKNELRRLALELGFEGRSRYSLGSNEMKAIPETDTEVRLRELWAQILKTSPEAIGIDDNFYHLGGDSIRIMFLTKAVEQRMGVKFASSLLNNNHGTVRLMAAYIDQARSGKVIEEAKKTDLTAEIKELSTPLMGSTRRNLLLNPISPRPEEEVVFLTGATGYLGSEMLRQLLGSPQVTKVATLVRAASVEAGMQRLKKMAATLGWWHNNTNTNKIEIWLGDLDKDNLGLGEDQLARLRGLKQDDNITSILHNGAAVNWNASYQALRKPNTESVCTLLKTTMESPVLPRFVFISGGAKYDIASDPTLLADALAQTTGYVQSKFVAEQIVKSISSKLPRDQNRVSTVKPGRIIGTSEEGIANLDDFLWRVVAAAASLGVYPEDENDHWMHVADVGTISRISLGHLFSENTVTPFNDISIGLPMSRFWQLVDSQLQRPCLPVSWGKWIERAVAQCSHVGEKHPLFPVQGFLGAMGTPIVASDQTTEQEVELEDALRSNTRYMLKTGYVEMCSGERDALDDVVVKRTAAK